ncbi:MAG: hypothetical protein ACK55Z_30815, partial [bacterium]
MNADSGGAPQDKGKIMGKGKDAKPAAEKRAKNKIKIPDDTCRPYLIDHSCGGEPTCKKKHTSSSQLSRERGVGGWGDSTPRKTT